MLVGTIIGIFGDSMGKRGVELYVGFFMLIGVLMGFYNLYEIVMLGNNVELIFRNWLDAGIMDGMLGMEYNGVTGLMVMLVTLVSGMVIVYSGGYMDGDYSYERYVSYICFFSGFMLILVTSDNLVWMFVGYEGVGVLSYLLICYWYTSLEGNRSGIQAVLVNRIGDVGVIIGICLAYIEYGSVRYNVIISMAESMDKYVLWIGFCIIVGAISKSAQAGLHIWLSECDGGF